MSENNNKEVVDVLDVAIIGAGFSGIGMAHDLLKAGEQNFAVFEREAQIGGTWYLNRYPGAGCDIQSNLYSFSYAQNKNWSRKFAKRDEIYNYLLDCATEFGVLPFVRCNHELIKATWDDTSHQWLLETSQGSFAARVLVCGTGYLSEPKFPNIPGIDSFAGTVVHPALWDESIDLDGKRVAVVGTGASTVQLVPAIQPLVSQLDVYQRSSGWVVPKPDKPYAGFTGWAMKNLPGFQSLLRKLAYYNSETHIWYMQRASRMGIPQKEATKHLEKSVEDPVLREKLRPEHVVGCKRYLFSDEYYPALQKPNVQLITDNIESISPTGVVTSDAQERPADVLVLATGYRATNLQFAERVLGASGKTLSETWSAGQYAYLGVSVPGFPNFFTLMGPNSTVVHTSATLMSEAQVNYVVDAVKNMKRSDVSRIDVKPDVVEKFNDEVQEAIRKGIWSEGCNSWYIDENGRNTAVWPFSIPNYKKRAQNFNLREYTT
ncbi:MAG: flavin-containing monooxygenase [Granulosicoccus sp.]